MRGRCGGIDPLLTSTASRMGLGRWKMSSDQTSDISSFPAKFPALISYDLVLTTGICPFRFVSLLALSVRSVFLTRNDRTWIRFKNTLVQIFLCHPYPPNLHFSPVHCWNKIMSRLRKRFNPATAEYTLENQSKSDEFDTSIPRAGKWSLEEENFAKKLIIEFESGTLKDCEDGCTLRSYLARRLNCAPMRISKKFAGKCIGKVFLLVADTFSFVLSHLFFMIVACICPLYWWLLPDDCPSYWKNVGESYQTITNRTQTLSFSFRRGYGKLPDAPRWKSSISLHDSRWLWRGCPASRLVDWARIPTSVSIFLATSQEWLSGQHRSWLQSTSRFVS